MKVIVSVFCTFLIACGSIASAASNTFLDYQNYNHGYCPDCNCCPCKCSGGGCYASESCQNGEKPPQDPVNPQSSCPTPDPCCPPATSTCTECGINICYVGLGLAALAAAAAIIVSSDNGSTPSHPAP